MRTITFRPVPGVGGGTCDPVTGSIADFVRRMPYLLAGGAHPRPWWVPPRAVLNNLFRVGSFDAGMSGGLQWEPFEIDESEYQQLNAGLVEDGYDPLPRQAPAWVQELADWRIWEDELRSGISSDEHRRLRRLADQAQEARRRSWDEAVERRDPTLPPRRHRELISALRAIEDLRAGREPGATDAAQSQNTAVSLAATLSDSRMARQAAERIGDPALIAEWEKREDEAARALAAVTGEVGTVLLQARASAVQWREP
jgi:hypothetical protein